MTMNPDNQDDEYDEDDLMAGGTSVGNGAPSRLVSVLWVLWFVFCALYLFL